MNIHQLFSQSLPHQIIKAANNVSLITNIASPKSNLFIEPEVYIQFLTYLHSHLKQPMTIYQKQFQDTAEQNIDPRIKKTINDLNINFKLLKQSDYRSYPINNNQFFNELYISPQWLDSDLKLIFTTATIHRHHIKIFPYSPLSDIGLITSPSSYDWSKITIKNALKILRADLKLFYQAISQYLQNQNIIGIMDARQVHITNEHLFFLKQKRENLIYISNNLEELEQSLLKLI